MYWGDEMGLRSEPIRRDERWSSWTNSCHCGDWSTLFGCNMISALTNKGQLCFMVFKKRFTTDVLLDFMKRLVRQNKRKVVFDR